MDGIDPYSYMQQVTMKMNELTKSDEIKTVLDEMEYLFEVITPEMQDKGRTMGSCTLSQEPNYAAIIERTLPSAWSKVE